MSLHILLYILCLVCIVGHSRSSFAMLAARIWHAQQTMQLSLVLYTINNKHLFDTNNEIHKYKTRNNNNLHFPIANLSKFNKGAYISGVKVLITFLNILKF